MGTNSSTLVFSYDEIMYVKTAADSEKIHINKREACTALIDTLDGDACAGEAGNRTITVMKV